MIDHPFQLRRIELRDFKSVAQASVDLRPLTVVVGPNSSGKSTLLQSILAVTQAVRAGTNTADFPLNGEFVRLGTFAETRNFRASRPDEPMLVAFELVDTAHLRRGHADNEEEDQPLLHLHWRAHVQDSNSEPGSGGLSGFARLNALEIEIYEGWPQADGELERVASCDLSSFEEENDTLSGRRVVGGRSGVLTSGRAIGASGRVQDWKTGASRAIDAVALAGGVPQSLMRTVGLFERLAEIWWNVAQQVLSEDLETQRAIYAENGAPNAASEVAISFARADLESGVGDDGSDRLAAGLSLWLANSEGDDGDNLYLRLGQLRSQDKRALAKSMVELGEATFRRQLRIALGDEVWIDDDVLVEVTGAAGDALWRCGFASQRFFRSDVRYLGPLREAPHVLYDPGPSKLDLGVRGEYSAAVLHAQAHTLVVAPLPDGGTDRCSLSAALNAWVQHLGLAQSVRSEDRGRMGIGLSVQPPGLDQYVDLTSVGVGVSQVLPILLLCLLAEPGSLVIVEQPELHLHPKLQQGLADFLLSCARSGRQIVVETHSEHLVNRLRYHIARDETDDTHDLIGIVFAENHNGVTQYSEPEVNVYGGLGDEWPAGFLDLTAKQSQDLVRESLAKRQRDGEPSPTEHTPRPRARRR